MTDLQQAQRETNELQSRTNELQSETDKLQRKTNKFQFSTAIVLHVAVFILGFLVARLFQ